MSLLIWIRDVLMPAVTKMIVLLIAITMVTGLFLFAARALFAIFGRIFICP